MRRILALFVWLGLLLMATSSARADASDPFERKILDELRSMDAGAVDLFVQANDARAREDHANAARLYGDVFARVPRFLHAERRRGAELVLLGRFDEGIALCRAAVKSDPSAVNLGGLAYAMLSVPQKGPLSSADAAEVQKLITQALALEPDNETILATKCQFALKQGNLALLETCLPPLERVARDHAGTLYLSWVLAMSKEEWGQAADIVARARAVRVPAKMLEVMQRGLDENEPWWRRWGTTVLSLLAGWILGFALLTLGGLFLSRFTLRHAEALSTSAGPEGATRLLRRTYAIVLVLCCGFYYVSLPIVLVAVVAMAGGIVYAMIAAGQIAIKLVALLVITVVVTFGAAIKSLFVRPSREEPGLKLDLGHEPKLRETLDEVAARIATQPVDTVYITADTNIAVFERKDGERCLLLGAAVMDGMALPAFKAILAHEYGHFSNRDTAGGGFALRVRRSLLTFILELAKRGQARPWNPTWWFATGFYRLFLRISQGASRLQEILADRGAALAYGGSAFAEGLRHVVERDVHFEKHAEVEVKRALETKRALGNLWAFGTTSGDGATEDDHRGLRSVVDERINRSPSPYDSHPSPRDRIRWVSGIAAPDEARSPEGMVWDLFANRPGLEREMTLLVYQNLAMRGIRLAHLPVVPDGGA